MEKVATVIVIILLALAALLWNPYRRLTTKSGSPFYPTEPKIVERLVKLAEIKPGDIIYDLGSGDGRIVIAAALVGAKAYGVEIDLLRCLYSRLWIKIFGLSKNAEIIKKSFYDVDLSKADVVFMFLLPETMEKLEEKLKRELKKGTKIVSYAFAFEDWKPVKVDDMARGFFGPVIVYKKS